MFRRKDATRRAGGRASFAAWMLVTVGLLVPSQWFAYRLATAAGPDERFPISAWSDPQYPPARAQAGRQVKPISPQIIDQIVAEKEAADPDPGAEPTPQPTPQPSPTPSGTRSPQPSPSPTGTPSPSPSGTPSPTPRPPAPTIEIRADHISAPDGTNATFYRWRVQIENPTNGAWIDDVRTLTQVPHGMQRVECGRGVNIDTDGMGSQTRAAAAPGVTCRAVGPDSSDDGHEMKWDEAQLGPGHVRVYTFEVRVTAGNGTVIRNHAHLNWRDGSRTTKVCEFEIDRHAPKGCRVSS